MEPQQQRAPHQQHPQPRAPRTVAVCQASVERTAIAFAVDNLVGPGDTLVLVHAARVAPPSTVVLHSAPHTTFSSGPGDGGGGDAVAELYATVSKAVRKRCAPRVRARRARGGRGGKAPSAAVLRATPGPICCPAPPDAAPAPPDAAPAPPPLPPPGFFPMQRSATCRPCSRWVRWGPGRAAAGERGGQAQGRPCVCRLQPDQRPPGR
jgi:hypothetical protein